MTTPNPYAWLARAAAVHFQREQTATQKPQLTLITTDSPSLKNRKPKMKTDQITAPTMPLHKHGAFYDIGAAVDFLALGADALKGIGAMMQPSMDVHDEQIDQANRSDLSAIFKFFGEALREPAGTARDATERLERAAKAMDARV